MLFAAMSNAFWPVPVWNASDDSAIRTLRTARSVVARSGVTRCRRARYVSVSRMLMAPRDQRDDDAVHVEAARAAAQHHADAAAAAGRRGVARADEREVRDDRIRERRRVRVRWCSPSPSQPSFSMPCGSVAGEPAPVRGVSCVDLQRDEVLQPSLEALGHVEVVVAGFVRDEVRCVDRAAPELERVVEAGHRLQERELGAAADRGEREGVELGVQRWRVTRELHADVAQLAAVVGVGCAAAVVHRVVRRPAACRRCRAGALELRS